MPALAHPRRTILKPLPADCLLDGQLHPNIAQRLARVRELPMTSVATLRAVERHGAHAYLVWEYIDGRPLAEHLAAIADGTARQREAERIIDEVERVVQTMHGFGIVHGAVHERNAIVARDGSVKLTHVSPLLYDDPAADLTALQDMRARFVTGQSA